MDTPLTSRDLLRKELRQRRLRLSPDEQDDCARRLAEHAGKHPLLSNARRIAAYLATNGEIDPLPLMESLRARGKSICLPVLVSFSERRLWFAEYEPGDTLICNRYGILEPEFHHRRWIKPAALDLVLTPLLAFDTSGHRLGMGGGYYDRSFAFLKQRTHWRKPRLLGLGYEFQKQSAIESESWDVPLYAVATEERFYQCHPHS